MCVTVTTPVPISALLSATPPPPPLTRARTGLGEMRSDLQNRIKTDATKDRGVGVGAAEGATLAAKQKMATSEEVVEM